MMQMMNDHLPFKFGAQSSETMPIFDSSFEDAIDRIIFPTNPLQGEEENEEQQRQEAAPENMRDTFINAFDDEDEDSDEESDADGDALLSPKRFDIICGRDKLSHAHVGNKRFRIVIEINRERYQTAPTRDDKTRITFDIVAMIRSCRPGGRFLKIDETNANNWEDVGDDYAREKVSHALRSAKDPSRKKVRKKRKAVPKTYSNEDNTVFSKLLEEQQRIFQRLVEEEEGRQKKRQRRDSYSSTES